MWDKYCTLIWFCFWWWHSCRDQDNRLYIGIGLLWFGSVCRFVCLRVLLRGLILQSWILLLCKRLPLSWTIYLVSGVYSGNIFFLYLLMRWVVFDLILGLFFISPVGVGSFSCILYIIWYIFFLWFECIWGSILLWFDSFSDSSLQAYPVDVLYSHELLVIVEEWFELCWVGISAGE